ncbi:MAG: hypothetical protein COA86_14370 [Kangiella sp.]|nr:MAG: hypothetical protein COA86_14370 [Kangiella sp.]
MGFKLLASSEENLSAIRGGVPFLWILLPISWAFGAYYLHEHMSNSNKYNNHLETGIVVSKDFTKVGIMKRPRLKIRIDGKEIIVSAVLSMDGINDLPERVFFYYSGDPKKEVYLTQETSALTILLFFFLTPLIGLVFIKWYEKILLRKIKA